MAHIRKRQFQPSNQSSITSFFSPAASSSQSSSSTPCASEVAPSLKPVLPDNVQSLLINVGMRVRKSVPEGYKTHKSMPTPTISYMHPSSLPIPANDIENEVPTSSAPELYSKPSELTPFCGLHKIGGFSSQPTSYAPTLSFSQCTVSSSGMPQTPKKNVRKRSYSDEIEDDLDDFFNSDKEQDMPSDLLLDATISPKSKYPISHSSMPNLGAGSGIVKAESRPKARMKRRSPESSHHEDFADEDVGFLQPMDCD